jgi:hypothetical protein
VFSVKRGNTIAICVAGYRNRIDAEKIADPDDSICAKRDHHSEKQWHPHLFEDPEHRPPP